MGGVRALLGDSAGAIVDYTKAIALSPNNPNGYSSRGFERMVTGDFSGALVDLEAAVKLNKEHNAYLQFHIFCIRKRLNQDDPIAELKSTILFLNNGWPKYIGKFLTGEINESTLLTLASEGGEKVASGQQCEAFFFIGITHLLNGDSVGARSLFTKCLATRKTDYIEYVIARAELARLNNEGR